MIEFTRDPHTAIISGKSGCGKTFFVMNLLTNEYLNHYDIVIVICPSFNNNSTYQDYIHLFENKSIKDNITNFIFSVSYDIESEVTKYSDMYKGKDILFILDDIIACEGIVKRRSSLTDLACSGRHTNRSLWVLTQKYNCVSKVIREQSSWVCSFFCIDENSFKDLISENNTRDIKIEEVDKFLIAGKRRKIIFKKDFPIYSRLCE